MSIIIFAKCQECDYHNEVFHLEWYQIMCRNCDAEIENDYVVEHSIDNNYVVKEGHQISGAPLHRDKGEAWKLETLGTLKIMYDDAVNHGHKELARIIEQGEDYLYSVIETEKEGELECK